jgi:5-methylcytosine-specific restriction enzyme subunit McrC
LKEIPIANIYYLLCYAWNQLEEKELTAVQVTEHDSLLDLFARVLISGMNRLLRRGLDRNYLLFEEEGSRIRGKINFGLTVRRNLLTYSRAHYEYDELDHNVLHNRIIKTVIRMLIQHRWLDPELKNSLILLHRRIQGIEEVRLSEPLFSRVRLNRNNAYYGFLINVCRMVYTHELAREGEGEYRFRDFLRDEKKMAGLFENFVRNFYQEELGKRDPEARIVGVEWIDWAGEALDDLSRAYLPKMKTDISIKWPDRYLIIDTKFYKQALGRYYDKETIISGHLYQLFAYLKNLAKKRPEYEHCEGMLLYPTVETDLHLQYTLHGHRITVSTIDLAQDWREIHRQLLSLVETPVPVFS